MEMHELNDEDRLVMDKLIEGIKKTLESTDGINLVLAISALSSHTMSLLCSAFPDFDVAIEQTQAVNNDLMGAVKRNHALAREMIDRTLERVVN